MYDIFIYLHEWLILMVFHAMYDIYIYIFTLHEMVDSYGLNHVGKYTVRPMGIRHG